MTIPRHIVKLIRDAFMVGMIVLSTGAFAPLFVDLTAASTVGEGSPFIKLIWGLIYLVAIMRIYPERRRALLLIQANKALALLVVLSVLSVLWSVSSPVTLHLAATLALTTLVSLDLSLHYSLKKQLQLLSIAMIFVMTCSVLAEVVFPGFIPGRDAEGTAWHGVFGFKNTFGRMICLAVIAGMAASRRSVWIKSAIVVCGLTLALFSKSVSAVGYVALMALFFQMLSILKWKPVPRRIAIACVLLCTALGSYYIVKNFAQVTAKLDKDPHLTGRVDLWEFSIADIQRRPLLGWGYSAFWTYTSQPARRIREAVNWDEAPHAHNGYIDLTLSVGMVGMAFYLFAFFGAVRRAYIYFMSGTENYRRWPLSFLAFALIYQSTESSIVAGDALYWILFCTICFSVAAEIGEVRTSKLLPTRLPADPVLQSIPAPMRTGYGRSAV